MARDFEKPVVRVVDETPPTPQEIVRLTSEGGTVTRTVPLPVPSTMTRLEPGERATDDKRTHEPDYEALAENEVIQVPLEETWDNEERESKPLPWGWFVLLGATIAGGAVWSLANLQSNKATPEAARSEDLRTLDQEVRERQEAESTVNRIMESVQIYCEADSVEKLAKVVRHPERVRPLMEQWYQQHPLKVTRFLALDLFQPVTLENRGSFWMVSCSVEGDQKRHLLIEVGDGGMARVDWETEVCYQPMDWDQYAKTRPQGSMDFRLRVEPDRFYSHEFSDSRRWACFRLSTLKGDQVLFGYVERASKEGQKLIEFLALNGNRESAVVLRISTPTDLKSPKGVVIEKLMSARWTYVEPPDT